MAESLTTRFGLKRWTADTDTPERTDFDAAHLELATNAAGWLPDDTLANRPAASAANARFLFRATDTELVYYSTGSAWLELGSDQIAVQTTAPTSPEINELWLDTDDASIAVTTSHNALGDLTTGDPHTQYANLNGTRAFTGEIGGVTPTVAASLATKGYVDNDALHPVELIERITLGADGDISFTGIPSDFLDLRLMLYLKGASDQPAINVYMQFNGDNGTNYRKIGHRGVGSGNDTLVSASTTEADVGTVVGNSGGTGSVKSPIEVFIPQYTGSEQKVWLAHSGAVGTVDTNDYRTATYTGRWTGTAALSSILLSAFSTSTLKAGSVASLYGWR